MLTENEEAIGAALYKDLHKHKNEVVLGELVPSKEEVNDALQHLDDWARDEKVTPALVNRVGVTCLKRKEPKGKFMFCKRVWESGSLGHNGVRESFFKVEERHDSQMTA